MEVFTAFSYTFGLKYGQGVGNTYAIHILQLDSSSNVCPDGVCLLYLTTISKSKFESKSESESKSKLDSAVASGMQAEATTPSSCPTLSNSASVTSDSCPSLSNSATATSDTATGGMTGAESESETETEAEILRVLEAAASLLKSLPDKSLSAVASSASAGNSGGTRSGGGGGSSASKNSEQNSDFSLFEELFSVVFQRPLYDIASANGSERFDSTFIP